jgi:hypothetical protein
MVFFGKKFNYFTGLLIMKIHMVLGGLYTSLSQDDELEYLPSTAPKR